MNSLKPLFYGLFFFEEFRAITVLIVIALKQQYTQVVTRASLQPLQIIN